ncbi:deoxyribose-phosphate aldolase [Sporomusa acidovorans]|uniref:Deoxyribose-phosphate aldolase n=1 Tax=Sporomusa acidovorans (strain ATCC 49682 / DSM 3132 / Mol) TaxID=1123286 RepID=A0ABZ3J6N4_SPOA4|nr:deoxyribose-phosphate aldolase [Sporomusa acidovorans]OZC21046.1 deoxyribose-phosphate aldolase [Sporomusa acidovorans DSM 3132]SDF17584.1 deoxyribose-phosphate aldolase [Sporomusa acidovorans]
MIDFDNKKQVAKAIQYTNVNPNLTKEGLLKHLETCVKYDFDAAMIAPCYVSLAKEVLKGTGIKVATTLNFPQANDTLEMKLAALKALVKVEPDQFDFPPNPGLLIGGREKEYFEEMKQIVEVSHAAGIVVKSMLEFGFLNEKQKVRAAQLACEAGIDWVKQSSGWGVGGCAATVEDVKILKENIQLPCRVKVSGKVNTLEKMQAMFAAGAELVGTSSGPAICDGLAGDPNAY